MFTGLIEDVGKVGVLRVAKGSAILTVKTKLPVRSMPLGASIAVNGACLTVVKKAEGAFTMDVSPETLKRTASAKFDSRQPGEPRAAAAVSRSTRRPSGDGACRWCRHHYVRSSRTAISLSFGFVCRIALGCFDGCQRFRSRRWHQSDGQ